MKVQWNAGDIGCGQLVFELSLRLKKMQDGDLIEVTASSPGAPADLPAWCSMTGHRLVSAKHPVYLIRCKKDPPS